MELLTYMPFRIFVSVLAFFLGSSIGSFSSCMAYRIVKEEKISRRSYCASCQKNLGFLDLVPVISFVFLRGRCRHCGEKIGIKELIIEILCGTLLCAGYLKFNFEINLYVLVLLLLALSFASMYDIYTMQIPDAVHICNIILCAILFLFNDDKLENLISAAIGGLLIPLVIFLVSFALKKVTKKDSLGFGDIKLIASTGIILGAYKSILSLLLMSLIGLLFVAVKRIKKGEKFPFAPCISISSLICYTFGDAIISAYMGLFI